MFQFLGNLAETLWDMSVQYHQFWSSFLSTTWIVIIGAVFCLLSYGVMVVEKRFNRDSILEGDSFFNDIWGVVGFGLLFVVMYFNDYAPWGEVTGVAGFCAWIGFLFFLGGLAFGIIAVGMSLYFLISCAFSGYKNLVRTHFISIITIFLNTFFMYTGLLMMSSFMGPVGVGIFFICCLFYPSGDSSYLGQVRDRNGGVWDVFRR